MFKPLRNKNGRIWQAIKTAIRVGVFGAVAALVAELQGVFEGQTDTVSVVLLGALAYVDNWIHENENIPLNGLWPF